MKADFIYGLPQALAEIKDLKAAALQLQADRQAERIVLARVIMELEEERKKTAALSGQLQQKDACILSLQTTIGDLQAERQSLLQQVAQAVQKGWQLQDLQRMIFGTKSERFVPTEPAGAHTSQLTLGHDFELPADQPNTPDQTTTPAVTKQAAPEAASRKNKRHVAHQGRSALSAYFPRIDQVHMPQGDITGCRKIGEVVSERYEYEQGRIYVLRDIRPQFEKQGGEGVMVAPMPAYIIDKGSAGPGLLAHMHVEKYTYHMPYYRQLQRFNRTGVRFAASTVNDWEAACAGYLTPLYELVKKMALRSSYLQCDETTMRVCNDIGKGKTHRGYYRVIHAPLERLVLFEYHQGRSQQVPRDMLQGFQGYLQTDAYAAYHAVFKDDPRVILLCCLVHARRKFDKALQNDTARATHMLEEIKVLYALEGRAREEGLNPQQILALRMQQAVPVLERMKAWLDLHITQTIASTPIHQAISYMLAIWDRLMVYTTDGRLMADTNLVENCIRPVALGRKNYMFSGNAQGAQRGAILYSLLETCKINDVDPCQWLKDVYTRIPTHPINRLHELLPSTWKQSREAQPTQQVSR